MRRWPGQRGQQTQCLLCIFGVPRQPTTKIFPFRCLSSTGIYQKRQGRPRGPDGDYGEQRTGIKSSRGKNNGKTQTMRRGPSRSPVVDYDMPTEAMQKMLKSNLTRLKDQLNQKREGQTSQFQSLDPDRTHWKKLGQDLNDLLSNLTSDLSAADVALREELKRLMKPPQSQELLQRHLHHLYLDKALQAKGLDVETTMKKIIDLRYPTEWYPSTRATQRDVHLHIGPTNSGKTYTALKRLEAAKSGLYAGPLRLLAHEVYSRLNAKGLNFDLVTGDDVRLNVNKEVVRISSTVEMADVGKAIEVAVIDEIQMIADAERGWAWSRAVLGMRAKELHLCGEPRVLPLVKELAASMGDNLHVHHYERLNPLKVESQSLRGDFKKLRKGDCVVTFSVVNIHSLRSQIEKETGRRVAIVYGSLPPETRAKQAALFNDPDNNYDYLVASDAIGMGLNLAVRRIVFDTVYKFDGVNRKQLSIPQIKQIAGRAGRYSTSHDDTKQQDVKRPNSTKETSQNVGWVTCMDEQDLPVIEDALEREAPPIRQAGLLPPGDFVIAYADRLPEGVPFDYIMQRIADAAAVHPRFFLCSFRDQMNIARVIDRVSGLDARQRVMFTASPLDLRTATGKSVGRALAQAIGNKEEIDVADISEVPLETLEKPLIPARSYLTELEMLHKSLILYLWLGYRFPNTITDQDMAFHAKALCEEKISEYLTKFTSKRVRKASENRMETASSLKPPSTVDGAVPDFSEHASEDLEENVHSDTDGETAVPLEESAVPTIDWSQGAESTTDMVDGSVQHGDNAARQES